MAERHIFCRFSTSSTSNLLPTPVSYKDAPVFVLSAEILASRFRFLFAKLPKSRSENDCHCYIHVNMKYVRVLEPSKWSMLTKVLHVRINNYWLLLFPNMFLKKTYLQSKNWLTNDLLTDPDKYMHLGKLPKRRYLLRKNE